MLTNDLIWQVRVYWLTKGRMWRWCPLSPLTSTSRRDHREVRPPHRFITIIIIIIPAKFVCWRSSSPLLLYFIDFFFSPINPTPPHFRTTKLYIKFLRSIFCVVLAIFNLIFFKMMTFFFNVSVHFVLTPLCSSNWQNLQQQNPTLMQFVERARNLKKKKTGRWQIVENAHVSVSVFLHSSMMEKKY